MPMFGDFRARLHSRFETNNVLAGTQGDGQLRPLHALGLRRAREVAPERVHARVARGDDPILKADSVFLEGVFHPPSSPDFTFLIAVEQRVVRTPFRAQRSLPNTSARADGSRVPVRPYSRVERCQAVAA